MSGNDRRFSRPTLLNACLIQQSLSHAGMDRLLLELGLNDRIPRGTSGMMARANALAQYVLANQDQLIDGKQRLALAVVERAIRVDPRPDVKPESVSDEVHNAFWTSLIQDGYPVDGGRLAQVEQPPPPIFLADMKTLPMPPQEAPAEQAVVKSAAPSLHLQALPQTIGVPPAMAPKLASGPTKVFLVHGHDGGLKHEVARFLEKIGLTPIILHERPNGGRALISKFQDEAADVRFAIVLMTPDDTGGLSGEAPKPRARQNVVFELGFFIGRLGPSNVCALLSGHVERPSDFESVVYVDYDPKGAWKNEIARELRQANIVFDSNALIG
jgi:hypothetical protein